MKRESREIVERIDWNVFCECVECMSIHPKGSDSTYINEHESFLAYLSAVLDRLADAEKVIDEYAAAVSWDVYGDDPPDSMPKIVYFTHAEGNGFDVARDYRERFPKEQK